VFVLDLLNSSFEDIAYIRYEMKQYLDAQPEELESPAEMMVIGDQSLEMIQGDTRSKADLLYALAHIPTVLPFKYTRGAFFWERFVQSMDALQQIALQNHGIPGRKNVIWVGHGGPNVNLLASILTSHDIEALKDYVHQTTNLMVDARVSLFVIYPGLKVGAPGFQYSALQADADLGNDDPFAGEINFGVMVNATGGKLYFNRNDVDREIAKSEELGADYYTLTYQPHNFEQDGKFRRIRVTLKNPSLRVVTKTGYYAGEKNEKVHPRRQALIRLAEASVATIPFSSLGVSLSKPVRHPDTRSVEFNVALGSKGLNWLPTQDGKMMADLSVAATSLDDNRAVLASKIEKATLVTGADGVNNLPEIASRFSVIVRLPRNTKCVRVAIEDEDGGRIGSAELDRKTINAAPEAPTPPPALMPHAPAPPQSGQTQPTPQTTGPSHH